MLAGALVSHKQKVCSQPPRHLIGARKNLLPLDLHPQRGKSVDGGSLLVFGNRASLLQEVAGIAMQSHSQEWYRLALEKFPFIQALEPLEGEISQSFYDAIVEEHITLRATAAIKKKNGGQLTRDDREREMAAIEKATSAVSKQYRRSSIKIHPDRHGDQYATEFEDLQHANDVLRDAKHRREYLEGFWGICDLIYQKRQKGEIISSESEETYLANRHHDWIKLNEEKFHADNPTARKPEMSRQRNPTARQPEVPRQKRPLQIMGGISSNMPRQIGIRWVDAKNKKAMISIPVLQPTHEFYACCKAIHIVLVDGAEERTLKKLKGDALEREELKDSLVIQIDLPDHGMWYIAWYATMAFDTEAGTLAKVTPRSYEARIDVLLHEHEALIQMKPVLLQHARQTAGDLRAQLNHSTHIAGLDIDELERRYWILHRAVSKARQLEFKVIEMSNLLGEKHSAELIALSEVLDSAAKPKAALEEAMEGKRVKNELKAFKCLVARKIESGEAAGWIKVVTEEELKILGGNSNRMYQFFVDGNRAKSLGVGADTLEAAAKREDFFTPKQCDKLLEVRDEVERDFAAESEAIRKQHEEEKRQAEIRKQLEEKAKEMPWGSVVRLFGLQNQPTLNGAVGTYVGVGERGRYRVRLFDQEREVAVLGDNFCLIHEYDDKVQQPGVSHNQPTTNAHASPIRQPEVASDNSYLYSNAKPPPKSNSVTPTQPSEESDRDSIVERAILVPFEHIGRIYGDKGSNLRHLKTVIGIDKVVVGTETVNGMREIRFFGDRTSVDNAEAFCANVLSITTSKTTAKPESPADIDTAPRSEVGGTGPLKFRHRDLSHAIIAQRLRKKGYINRRPVSQLTVQVPSDRRLDKLIGPQSKGLKQIVDTTGVDMIIVYKHTGNDGMRGIQLTGPPGAVLKAAKLCSSHTNGSRSPRKESDSQSLSHLIRPHADWAEAIATPTVESIVLVPSQSVGWLIGKQGRTLQRLADTSGGVEMINVCKSSFDGLQEVQLVGSPTGVKQAESECSRILLTMNQHEQSLHSVSTPSPVASPGRAAASKADGSILKTVDVPRELAGELIGKHGSHLHEMKRITGVDYVNVDPKVVDGARKLRIKGPEASVAKVVALVDEFCSAKLGATTTEAASAKPDVVASYPGLEAGGGAVPAMPNVGSSPPGFEAIHKAAPAVQNVVAVPPGYAAKSGMPLSPAWTSPAQPVAEVSPDRGAATKQDGLLNFLQSQSACLKCSAEKFHAWLQSEDITTLDDLVDAIEDDDFVRSEMQRNGLKVRCTESDFREGHGHARGCTSL